MTIGIGIIGAGVMGSDHARIIAEAGAGAHVSAVFDADPARAQAVAEATGAGRAATDPYELIASAGTAAILVASPDATHADFVLACLKAGKPVLCEKPLAPTSVDCLRIIEAEMALGRRAVQVGFMRRFDPAYMEMKQTVAAGRLGDALMLHCVHRNVSSPSWFESMMSISNSAVHEIDIARWLLDDELLRTQVHRSKPAAAAKLQDPMFITFETTKGRLITVELFLNAGYGYDVRCEIVCERGTVTMTPPDLSHVRIAGQESFSFALDWRPRFAAAYRIQMQQWIGSIVSGTPVGASAWDGYVATAVAEASIGSLNTGQAANIVLEPRPAFYQ